MCFTTLYIGIRENRSVGVDWVSVGVGYTKQKLAGPNSELIRSTGSV